MKLRSAFAAFAATVVLASIAGAVASSYERSVANVLVSEGSRYENHPADPGGPTKYGITIYDVRLYVKKGATAADVKALTRDQALTIYHDKYWMHPCVRADALPAGLDYQAFDHGVNAGVGRGGKVLRKILGLSTADCKVTDGVIKAIAGRDTQALIHAYANERRRYYAALIASRPSLGVFRRGWMARANSAEAVSLRMAGAPAPTNLFGEEVEPEPAYGPGKAWLGR